MALGEKSTVPVTPGPYSPVPFGDDEDAGKLEVFAVPAGAAGRAAPQRRHERTGEKDLMNQ